MADEFPTPEPPPSERRAPAGRRRSPGGAVADVSDVDFPLARRGYDRAAVDAYVKEVAAIVAELETTQSRDSVVKAALDDVGEHTGQILKKAHEAADEITSRSRAQAEGRLQGAEAEAETLLRDAEQRAREIEADLGELWDERVRLIEDLRRLSDQMLVVADDAGARLQPPRGEEPTGESELLDDGDPGGVEGEAYGGETEQLTGAPDLPLVDQPTVESPAARPDTEPLPDEDPGPPGDAGKTQPPD